MTDATAPTTIEIRVIPRARRNEVGGTRNGRLLVRTTAPPADGAANKAVVRLVAGHLGVPRSRVTIVSGTHARDKTLRIDP